MTPLPPLTEKIDKGAHGGHEFERLMHRLLLRHADRCGFLYRPVHGAGGDAGLDGTAPDGGVPGMDGPVIFQFKWLFDDIHKGSKARQIRESLERAAKRYPDARHWVLVTPWDLKPSEDEWLQGLPVHDDLRVHHWGQTKLAQLFEDSRALFARYYPHEARHHLDGYDGHEFKTFAGQYRSKVALAHGKLRTLGLPPETLRERDATHEIRLRDIFVPLKLVPEGGETESLADVLKRERSFVVLGDPGTGKSTLLAFLALLFAGEAELPGFKAPSGVVPLHVPLRDFVLLRRQRPDLSVLEYLESRARSDFQLAHAHRAFFDATLAMGEAVVLLDGLDEVGGEGARRRLASTIRAFRDEYPGCPVWVTSRVYGYTSDVRLPSESFAHARVGRLDQEQIEDFVGRWYQFQLPHNDREREERTASLRNAVQRTPGVKRLASNPLLLTLMAFIHHGLRRLPQDRGELYEKCVEMLLRTWQEGKREETKGDETVHPFERLGLHVHKQKDYLAHLAMYVQEQDETKDDTDDEARGLISRQDALERLAKRHHESSQRTRPELGLGEAREEMRSFLEYVSDRTGLLIDRGGGKMSFLHLSFQEYLAAWVFACGGGGADSAFFLEHLGKPTWEEVLLLRLYADAGWWR